MSVALALRMWHQPSFGCHISPLDVALTLRISTGPSCRIEIEALLLFAVLQVAVVLKHIENLEEVGDREILDARPDKLLEVHLERLANGLQVGSRVGVRGQFGLAFVSVERWLRSINLGSFRGDW